MRLGNIDGLKMLLEIEREARIMSVGKYSWAYSFALQHGFDIPTK